jgi:hypothetical protein
MFARFATLLRRRRPSSACDAISEPGSPSVRRLVDGLLLMAITRDAAELRFEPSGGEVRVRFRVDGRWLDACTPLPSGAASGLASVLKEYARLDANETERSQVGVVRLTAETRRGSVREVRLLVQIRPTLHGEATEIRIRGGCLRYHATTLPAVLHSFDTDRVTVERDAEHAAPRWESPGTCQLSRAIRLARAANSPGTASRRSQTFEPHPPGLGSRGRPTC